MSKKQNNNQPNNKNDKSFLSSAFSRKSIWAGAALNLAVAGYVGKKEGAKAGLAVGALGTLWTVASAAYWESIHREQNKRNNDNDKKGPDLKP